MLLDVLALVVAAELFAVCWLLADIGIALRSLTDSCNRIKKELENYP